MLAWQIGVFVFSASDGLVNSGDLIRSDEAAVLLFLHWNLMLKVWAESVSESWPAVAGGGSQVNAGGGACWQHW